MTILSNVRSGWLAMPLVAGFLEMFAGVPYNREKKTESLACTPTPPRGKPTLADGWWIEWLGGMAGIWSDLDVIF